MKSIWEKTSTVHRYPVLEQDSEADVAIIGGGMAGVLIANQLQEAGKKVIVLEAREVGSGQTKHTTAKITSQHDLIYDKLIQSFGIEKARQYLRANECAIREYQRLVKAYHIDCDFTECPAYLYSTAEKESLEKEACAAQKLGIDAEFTVETELPFTVKGAVKFPHQAKFHPLKFLAAMADKVPVYEYTKAKEIKKHTIITQQAKVTAEHIVFACHYPFINTPGYYFFRMHQERSYVLALKHVPQYHGMYYGVDPKNGYSFRSDGDVLLFGGGNHRTGDNRKGGKYEQLVKAAREYFPDCEEVTRWSAQDCMTLDQVPYIGKFSSATPNWFVATGFQKWGMTSSMVSALLIRDLIVNGESPFQDVFSPQRFTVSASAKTLMEESAQSVKSLSKEYFQIPSVLAEDLALGHGGVVSYEGKKVGVYKDLDGKIIALSTRCPHLGCQLEWNPDEQSWDCPCHGSRFDAAGKLMDDPAQRSLSHES